MITIPRTARDFAHPKLKVIALGGAGGNALDRIVLDGLPSAELVAINTDLQALTASVAPQRVQIGQSVTRGLGAGGDPEIGRQAAEECAGEMQKVIGDATIVFVLVGLGGGTGSGALPVLVDQACEQNVFTVVLGTLPFGFEGKRRAQQAAEALDAVRGLADLVMCFENDKMGDLVAPNASVQSAFTASDQVLGQCVRAMAALVHRRGLLRASFDEIGQALRGGPRSYFGYGEATGDNRAHDALTAAFKSPLLDHGRALKHAESVVVQVVGGTDLTLNELNIAMEEINRSLGEQTHLYVGTATDSQLNGYLTISIFCGGLGGVVEALPPARHAEPVAIAVPEPEPEPLVEQTPGPEPEPVAVQAAPEVEEEYEEEEFEEEEEVTAEAEEEEYEEEEEIEEPVQAQAPAPAPRVPTRSVFAPMTATRRPETPARELPAATEKPSLRQEQMHFEPQNRGRFEKSEPTIIDGQDLDVPTFMRRHR